MGDESCCKPSGECLCKTSLYAQAGLLGIFLGEFTLILAVPLLILAVTAAIMASGFAYVDASKASNTAEDQRLMYKTALKQQQMSTHQTAIPMQNMQGVQVI